MKKLIYIFLAVALISCTSNSTDQGHSDTESSMSGELGTAIEEGKAQVIYFPPIADQIGGVQSLKLPATSDSGLPVSYYVKKGPVKVQGDLLIFEETEEAFPIEVEVVALQNGEIGKWRAAQLKPRTFYIHAPDKTKVAVNSLAELDKAIQADNQEIIMAPGTYQLRDYLNQDSVQARRSRKYFQYFTFSGSGNTIKLDGVLLEVDTKLREEMGHPIHTDEILISGKGNRISGLEIKQLGHGLSPGGSTMNVAGRGNLVEDITLHVQGSFPYGYGDLFGKGGPDVIRHKKHSGLRVTGFDSEIYRCKLYMKAFGHGFYVQENAENVYFEDCYVEGELRSTDDILKETEGPAFDVKFRTWTPNREGEYIVTPGYVKSLCEDGFRVYGVVKNISFKNCTAKNTRGGFELRTHFGTRLENCTTIGTERAYWIRNEARVINCKGDASHGPLIFVEGSDSEVELYVMPAESEGTVHSLATIQGKNNHVTFKPYEGQYRKTDLPILIGYTHPEHGESMSPYGQAPAEKLLLINDTKMPVVIGDQGKNSEIRTNGAIESNEGSNIKVIDL